MKVIFNLNDNVRVEVTARGYEVWEKHWRDLKLPVPDLKQKIDPDGRHTFQMHEVMNIFGPYCYNGCKPPIKMEVEIPGQRY